MAKSSRIKRRAMARSRSVRRSGFSGFYAAVIAIIVVGTVLVLVSRRANDAGAVGPYLNGDSTPHSAKDEHWHAAVGVNICGVWQPGPIWDSFTSGQTRTLARHGTNTYAGLHTHQLQNGQSDGLIHMEPATPDEAGKHATFGLWLEYGGWKMSDSSMKLWTGANGKPIVEKNGDTCPAGMKYAGQKAEIRWALGKHEAGKTTKLVEQTGGLVHYKLYDQDVIGVYFLPKDVKLDGDFQKVPSESNLATPSAGEGAGHTNVGSTTTTPSGSTSTTKPGSSTTGTTKQPGSSTTGSSVPPTSAVTTIPSSSTSKP